MVQFPVILEPDEKSGWTVLFPDLPYGVTQGDTVGECLTRAQEVILLVLEDLMAGNKPIPVPRRRRGRRVHYVTLPLLESAKIELHESMRAGGVTKAALARRMKLHRQQVDRLLDLGHGSRLDQVEAAFAALGKRLSFTVEDAA
ncbi:MAG: type II toxin-antitoxin system HicB family antitoxin [Acidobacteria bacterium]|nr:type II toxin-antitoxin system HicB family antitoxin [Acidobacteriota bacterium]